MFFIDFCLQANDNLGHSSHHLLQLCPTVSFSFAICSFWAKRTLMPQFLLMSELFYSSTLNKGGVNNLVFIISLCPYWRGRAWCSGSVSSLVLEVLGSNQSLCKFWHVQIPFPRPQPCAGAFRTEYALSNSTAKHW